MRVHRSRGTRVMRRASTFRGSSPWQSPSRFVTRSTWVSTAMPSLRPKAWPRTTLAVFRPTPGSLRMVSTLRGISPPWSRTRPAAKPMMLLVLARKNPVERMMVSTSAGAASARLGAVGKRAKSKGVTWLTRSSVHWAERMVATLSSKGVR